MNKYKLFLVLGLIFLIVGCSYSIEIDASNKNNGNVSEEETNSTFLVVPDVSGMTENDAKNILKLNGFEVEEIVLVENTKFEEGLVVKTLPNSGQRVKEGTLVNLYVSTNFTYEVEDYKGKNYLTIKSKLEELGLVVEVKEKSFLAMYEEFTIVEQEPSVGTILSSGDKVILYIPEVEVLYPDFVGEEWTVNEIEDFCRKHEINLVKNYQKIDNKKSGIIVMQSRKTGTKIVKGSTLTITISKN